MDSTNVFTTAGQYETRYKSKIFLNKHLLWSGKPPWLLFPLESLEKTTKN